MAGLDREERLQRRGPGWRGLISDGLVRFLRVDDRRLEMMVNLFVLHMIDVRAARKKHCTTRFID